MLGGGSGSPLLEVYSRDRRKTIRELVGGGLKYNPLSYKMEDLLRLYRGKSLYFFASGRNWKWWRCGCGLW